MTSSCSISAALASSNSRLSKKRKKDGTASTFVTVLPFLPPLPFFFTVACVRSLPGFQWISQLTRAAGGAM